MAPSAWAIAFVDPFSYLDETVRWSAIRTSLALKIVDAIRQRLGNPKLPVELVPITSGNRFRLIQGEIDFECGSTTHNSERAEAGELLNTIFVIGTRVLTRRDSGISDFNDLNGKRVVTTASTTSEHLLRQMKEERQIDLTLITARDHGEIFHLETGRADAFMLDDALLYGEVGQTTSPGRLWSPARRARSKPMAARFARAIRP